MQHTRIFGEPNSSQLRYKYYIEAVTLWIGIIGSIASIIGLLIGLRQNHEADARSIVTYDLSVSTMSIADKSAPKARDVRSREGIAYKVAPEKRLIFLPDLPFIRGIKSNKKIEIDNSLVTPIYWTYFFPFPALDIKVTNNSNATQYITRAEIEILNAEADNFPILYVRGRPGALVIENLGWGVASGVSARASLKSGQDDPIEFSQDIGAIEGGNEKSYAVFEHWETKMNERSMKEAELMNKNSRGFIIAPIFHMLIESLDVTGRIVYMGPDNREMSTLFSVSVPRFSEYRSLAPLGSSFTYFTSFDQSEGETMKTIPVSHTLNPGESDRFHIVVIPDRSAAYRCRITIFTNMDRLESKDFDLRVFRPNMDISRSY